jgi:hypothetical protein
MLISVARLTPTSSTATKYSAWYAPRPTPAPMSPARRRRLDPRASPPGVAAPHGSEHQGRDEQAIEPDRPGGQTAAVVDGVHHHAGRAPQDGARADREQADTTVDHELRSEIDPTRTRSGRAGPIAEPVAARSGRN